MEKFVNVREFLESGGELKVGDRIFGGQGGRGDKRIKITSPWILIDSRKQYLLVSLSAGSRGDLNSQADFRSTNCNWWLQVVLDDERQKEFDAWHEKRQEALKQSTAIAFLEEFAVFVDGKWDIPNLARPFHIDGRSLT